MHRVLPDSGAAPASTRVRGCTQPHEQSCGACLERFFEPLTAAAAPAPDMATAKMIAHSTARPPQKHRRSDMRDARHAEAARPTPTMVNRRAPDKTHPRQPTPGRHGGRATQPPRARTHLLGPAARADAAVRTPSPQPAAERSTLPDGFIAVIAGGPGATRPGIHSTSTPNVFICNTKVD